MHDTAVLDHYLAPLRPFLAPEAVTELVVNRPGEIGVEMEGRWRWHETPELTESWLRTLAVSGAAYTRQDVGPERPICSTTLPGDLRCQIVLPPVAGVSGLAKRRPSHPEQSSRNHHPDLSHGRALLVECPIRLDAESAKRFTPAGRQVRTHFKRVNPKSTIPNPQCGGF